MSCAAAGLTWRRRTLSKSPTRPRSFMVANAYALADRLERNQRPQSDRAMAVKLIRALLAGQAAGDGQHDQQHEQARLPASRRTPGGLTGEWTGGRCRLRP